LVVEQGVKPMMTGYLVIQGPGLGLESQVVLVVGVVPTVVYMSLSLDQA
jgi:hypothetical protein